MSRGTGNIAHPNPAEEARITSFGISFVEAYKVFFKGLVDRFFVSFKLTRKSYQQRKG
jgi:hypothetical protein